MTRYDVTITRLPLRALFEMRGALPGDAGLPPPPAPLRLTQAGDRVLAMTGPARWLLMAPLAQEETLERALPEAVALSDTLTFFAITGLGAGQIMAVASPLDLHASAFPEDGCAFTEAFGIRALVRRLPGGFEIGVDASHADWFAAMLDRVAGCA
ncbi:sarcosine oxidase subunit gamma [Thetidibacter halocola]|uniref:Sarcosine oxidase subunit gamma n=1 Tax=Thetidibacter halocola TaxID=2827239 RepID=A0A8J7WE68_9RHOB|nr:sarcosine oxidase subunit gamma [Thetidibacter halocola]MBS0124071.1 sarcosine oxidase subunit gamma [Thetidibacter halocola]